MSEIVGMVVNVYDEWIGSTLAEDAASGTSELVVENGEWFGESGSLRIGDEEFTYTAEGDTLTLGDTLDNAYEEGEFVYVLPLASMRWAQVQEAGSAETLLMRVPHALRALLDEGVRPEGRGEEIEGVLGVDGVAVITDVLGREPRIEGEFIREHSVRPEAITDGEPPASSPTPEVSGGIGSLVVRWHAISNHDPVTYEVHVSDSQGFTPGPSTLAAEVQGTLIFIRTLPAGGALQGGTTYYVRLVARDHDGAAAPSDEASGEIVVLNTGDIPSDGQVPPQVDMPSVTPGPGFLFVEWEPVENADPVAYEVHVGDNPLFTPGPSTLYATTPATSIVVNKEPDGSDLDLGQLYYLSIVATDPDGAATPSGVSAGVAPAAQITETLIADNAISTPKLQANSVVAGKIAANAVTAGAIAANAVTAAKIAANAVTASEIAANAVTAAKIAANAVTAEKILADEALFELLQTVLLVSNKIAVPGTSGPRQELDASGYRLYSGDDEASINFDTSGGNAYLRGLVEFGSGSSLLPGNVIELATSSEGGEFQTPQIVQHRGAWGSGTSTGSWKLAPPTQQGTLQVLAVFTFGASVTHSTPAGWTQRATRLSGTQRLTLFVRTSGTSISSLPTFSFSSPVGWKFDFFEIAGVELESADAAATGAGTSATASVGPTAPTTQARELALAFVYHEPGGVVPITPSGWESQGAFSIAALDMSFGTFSRQLTSIGTQSVSISLGASRNWVAALATFKAAASADPPAAAPGALRVYVKEADSAVRPFVRDESGNPKELVAIENGLGTHFGVENLGAGNSGTPGSANILYYVQVRIPVRATLTGILYRVAGTASGNVRSALYDADGNRVANRTTNSAQSSAGAGSIHRVAFDEPYVAEPGVYYMALIFSAANATFQGGVWLVPCNAAAQASFTTPASIFPPSQSADIAMPRMSTY